MKLDGSLLLLAYLLHVLVGSLHHLQQFGHLCFAQRPVGLRQLADQILDVVLLDAALHHGQGVAQQS